jgi:hypothetical protein
MGYSLPMGGAYTMSESVQRWMNKESTQDRFVEKYGVHAEEETLRSSSQTESDRRKKQINEISKKLALNYAKKVLDEPTQDVTTENEHRQFL